MRKCKVCGTKFQPRYRTTEMFCSHKCANEYKREKKPIKQNTPKRAAQMRQYSKDRKEFLSRPENRICFIPGCNKRATTIEHRKGRDGDLLLDQRYWAPCCLEHNLDLENNPELARAHKISRLHDGKL